MRNPESLTGIADGLKALARAVQDAPGALKTAYQAGFLDGAVVATVILILVYLIKSRNP